MKSEEEEQAMPRPACTEVELARRYLRRELAAHEVEAFEEHLLTCPHCLDELELGSRFDRALKGVVLEDALPGRPVRLRQVAAPRWLLAAGLAGLLVLPAVWLWQRSAPRELPQINTPLLTLSPTRAAGGEPDVRLTLTPGVRFFVLALEVEEPGPWSALLLAGERALWQTDGLTADASGTVVLSLPARLVAAGIYELRLQSAEDAPPLTFSFLVVAGEKTSR